MTRLVWNDTGKRLFETGLDRSVLYLMDVNGAYPLGVAWNGLISLTESPSGAESSPLYGDNLKYLTLMSVEEFTATLEAYTYPEEFEECDGSKELATNLGGRVTQQARKKFGLVYRTKLGNDVAGDSFGYKLHLLYGCLASPSEKAYAGINDSPEAITFSWEISTTPTNVIGFLPTSIITIDSTLCVPAALSALESQLFGDTGIVPNLPLPDAVKTILYDNSWLDVTPPSGWTWELPFTIQQRIREFRAENFDLRTYANITGTAYYVKPDGNDADTGVDWDHALKSIQVAADKTDSKIVYIQAGTYSPEGANGSGIIGWGWGGNPAKCFIGVGGQVIHTLDFRFYSPAWIWTLDTNHYELSVGIRVPSVVYDTTVLDARGAWTEYTHAADEAGVDSTPGSWYKDGSNVLHIRTLDDRIPDSNLRIIQNVSNCNIQIDDNRSHYFENITFEGSGQRLFRGYAQSATGNGKLYMKNCNFIYGYSGYDNANFYGVSEVILENCKSYYGYKDAFNYTNYLGILPKAIEINCEGYYTGVAGEGTHQASTSHGGSAVVRINGKYHHTHGEGVADVGSGTKTWNLGCESYSSICTVEGISRSAFYVDTGATMWLDSCWAHDVPTGGYCLVAAAPGDTLHHRNQIGTTQGGTGTIDTY